MCCIFCLSYFAVLLHSAPLASCITYPCIHQACPLSIGKPLKVDIRENRSTVARSAPWGMKKKQKGIRVYGWYEMSWRVTVQKSDTKPKERKQ